MHAAALVVGLFVLWTLWSPQLPQPEWLVVGAIGVGIAALTALSMRIVDREGAPYAGTPGWLLLSVQRMAAVWGSAADVARRAVAGEHALHPGLVRLRTKSADSLRRAAFASAVTAPGLLVVESSADSLLVHALVEDDADEGELAALEARVSGDRA
jgi:multisubunit Na+/H+ antiporter MnhE subunit